MMRTPHPWTLMTYCVALRLDSGMIFASDSRTNAGVDHIATFMQDAGLREEGRPRDRGAVLRQPGHHPGRHQHPRPPRSTPSRGHGRPSGTSTSCTTSPRWWATRCARCSGATALPRAGQHRRQRQPAGGRADQGRGRRACSTSIRRATSSRPRTTRSISSSARASTASPSSTAWSRPATPQKEPPSAC